MAARERDRYPVLIAAALGAGLVLAVVVGVILWWLLLNKGAAPEEPEPIRIEAEGPQTGPIVTPAPVPVAVRPRVEVRSVEERVAARLTEDLPTTRLEGPVRILLDDVEWEDPGHPTFVEADEVAALLDVGALMEGGVLILEATVGTPLLRLVQDAPAGGWNYERVLGSILDGGEARAPNGPLDFGPRIRIRDVAVLDGTVLIDPAGPDTYVFAEIDALVPRADLAEPGEPPIIEVQRLSLNALLPQPTEELAVSATDVTLRLPDGAVVVEAPRLEAGDTRVADLALQYVTAAPGLGIEATGRVERVAFEDVRFLLPELPPEGAAAFDFQVEPAPGGRTAVRLDELVAEADDSRVAGAIALALAGPEAAAQLLAVDLRLEPLTVAMLERFVGPLPYTGALRGTIQGTAPDFAFDIAARLLSPEVAEPFLARISGGLTFDGDGFALRAADIDLEDVPLEVLRPLAPGLPLAGRVSGRVTLEGPPGATPLALDVQLTFAEGSATLAGSLDLTGPVPAYDFSGQLLDVSLPALLEPEVPPVSLTAGFTLQGTGTDPATANARLGLRGRFTGWQTGPSDTVRVSATVADGTLALESAALRLATLDLAVDGTWQFVEPGGGALTYDVVVSEVRPFAPYLPFLVGSDASGALRTQGVLSGTLDVPRFTGTLEGANLAYGEWAAEELDAEYDIALREPTPDATVEAVARMLEAPGDAIYDIATAQLLLEDGRFSLVSDAERAGGGDFGVTADGWVEEDGTVDALVRRLNLELDGQRWRLVRTARVEWVPEEGAEIRDLLLQQVDGEGRVAVDGPLPPRETASLRVEVAALPVGEVLEMIGREPVVTGDLWLEARAFGPPDAPRVGADFRLVGGRVGTVYATQLTGAILFENERLAAEATALLDTLGTVEFDASVPIALNLGLLPSAEVLEGRPLRATLRADTLPLSAVEMLTPEIQDAEGAMRAFLSVSGTPDAPALTGSVQVWNGALTIRELDQRYEEISADIVLEGQTAYVREARARSDGWAVATGTVTFPTLMDPVVDLVVQFDGFRAVGADDREPAAAWGQLAIAGELSQPVITGDVTLDDGDINIPTTGDDLDQAVVGVGETTAEVVLEVDEPQPAASWFDRLTLDEVIVEAGEDLWVSLDEQARAQVAGELVLLKAPTESIRIFGDLAGERGTFTIRVGPIVRRFDIVSVEVNFLGSPELNPAIDIVASRFVPSASGQPLEIRVLITGTLDAPNVALTTADGANIPESEILSYLLFGQPSFALADDGLPTQPLLEEALFGVGSLAEIASIELEEALIADLGLPLDYFQIRPAPGQRTDRHFKSVCGYCGC